MEQEQVKSECRQKMGQRSVEGVISRFVERQRLGARCKLLDSFEELFALGQRLEGAVVSVCD
jgi:hypothetical protein